MPRRKQGNYKQGTRKRWSTAEVTEIEEGTGKDDAYKLSKKWIDPFKETRRH